MEFKAARFGDFETLSEIRQSKTPREAKKLGRKVKGFNPIEWDKIKYECMMSALMFKWDMDKDFRYELSGTGDKILVEASTNDRIWGIGFEEQKALKNREKWGENLLGIALMQVREYANHK